MRRQVMALIVAVCTSLIVAQASAGAQPPPADPPASAQEASPPAPTIPDRVLEPDRRLGPNWRTSGDRAVTLSGDETGLHVLVADAREAYGWRTAATLAEPGLDTDQWIGQFCVTASGRRAVVVYAPRQFTNREHLMARGGLAAVVDLSTGTVVKLPERVSLAYHNPGCNGELATLSRLEVSDAAARTWVGVIDTARGRLSVQTLVRGQVTSALPYHGRVIGVKGHSLMEIDRDGTTTEVARASGSPHRLLADGSDALALQVMIGADVQLTRYHAGRLVPVATVPAGTVRLRSGAAGRVYAVGAKSSTRTRGRLPTGWVALDSPPDSDVSTTGALTVSRAITGREAAGRKVATPDDGVADQVRISARLSNGIAAEFSVQPSAGPAGRVPSPAGGASTAGPDAGIQSDYSTVPYDPDRICAVARNDPTIQVYQPTPQQVEWAADLAVRGQLTFQRPANWLNSGMPAYAPQGLFPPLTLSGGGNVPAQVMLAILAQESNMWQASFHAVDASVGNPLTSSGFYGIEASSSPDPRAIDWSRTDCGYGAGQVTSGMRVADTDQWVAGVQWTYTKQKTVVLDYATNISAALRILQDKWNVTRSDGLIANNGDPRYIENWWFAIWAYNTGFYPQSGSEPWGVGYANNVANQDYPADRQMFLTAPLDVPEDGIDDEIGYDNAKHPNHWSYPERVIGFAYTSLRRFDYQFGWWAPTYRTAVDNGKFAAQPGRFTFCSTSVNECDPAAQHVPAGYPGTPPGPCLRDDLKCWWHAPVTWVDCAADCGTEDRRYTTVDPRPFATNIYPTPVNSDGTCAVVGLPAGVRIVDDINTTVALGAEGCLPTYTRGGTFGLKFGSMTGVQGAMIYPSKVDFHQIGGGFGGHFWFAHTLAEPNNAPLKVTGTWLVDPTNAWTRVFVHVPDHGAHTRQADYKIYLPGQSVSTAHRAIPTRWEVNTWLDIGVFDFRGMGSPKIELSNFTADGTGLHDIAWDAVAVQPLPAKPAHFVVGMGDSFSSGEGAAPYSRVSDQYGDDRPNKNACRRSPQAWARKIVIPGTPGGQSLGALADSRHATVDLHHIACAGARTHNVMATRTLGGQPAPANASGQTPAGMEGELTQLDQGFVDANTTLVVLTIGGNDALWTEVMKGCAFNDCLDPNFRVEGETAPPTQTVPARLSDQVKPDVRRVLTEVRERAPNAWIILAGYPQLFKSGTTYDANPAPGWTVGITAEEVTWLNQMAGLAATEILYSDIPGKINSIDIRTDFAGHELGTADLTQNWLNGYIFGDAFRLPDDDGEPNDSVFGTGSFHPNVSGYTAYGGAASDRLNALGYIW